MGELKESSWGGDGLGQSIMTFMHKNAIMKSITSSVKVNTQRGSILRKKIFLFFFLKENTLRIGTQNK